MKRACLLIRRNVYTRWRSFEEGLQRLGFEVTDRLARPHRGDLMIIWNRYPRHERWAREYEQNGGVILVAENGWIGKAPPDGTKPIALCRGHHNGAGYWPEGGPERWDAMGVELAPWRETGIHLLVLPQRGFGEPGVAMPRLWLAEILGRLRAVTTRPVVVRHHPGIDNPRTPDWTDCWAAVTWGSGAGIKALAAGIPVFYDMPQWIGGAAARQGVENIEAPYLGNRLAMFRRLAWAQWSAAEIATGEPFARLI